MDATLLDKLLFTTFDTIAQIAFKTANSIFSMASSTLWNQKIFKYLQASSTTLLLSILLGIFIFKYRGQWKLFAENRRTLMLVGVASFLTIFQYQIMSFTLNIGNLFFNDNQIVHLLNTNSNTPSLLITAIFKLVSSGIALVIAFSQMIEVISLKIILLTVPLVLLMDTSQRNGYRFSTSFIREIIKITLSPIIQALIFYVGFNALKAYPNNSPKFLMTFMILLSSIYANKVFGKLFESENVALDLNKASFQPMNYIKEKQHENS